jgi:hypothetical protein
MRFPLNLGMSFCSRNLTVLLVLTLGALSVSMPAHAFTCEDVRGLSIVEQNYWSKRLHLTSTERHLIWVACYRDYHGQSQELVRR